MQWRTSHDLADHSFTSKGGGWKTLDCLKNQPRRNCWSVRRKATNNLPFSHVISVHAWLAWCAGVNGEGIGRQKTPHPPIPAFVLPSLLPCSPPPTSVLWLLHGTMDLYILNSIVLNSYYAMLKELGSDNLPPEHPILATWNNGRCIDSRKGLYIAISTSPIIHLV